MAVRVGTQKNNPKPKVSNNNPWAWGSADPGQIWTDTAKGFSQALGHGAQQIADFYNKTAGGPIQGFASLFNPPKQKAKPKPKPKAAAPQPTPPPPYSMVDALNDARRYLSDQSGSPQDRFNAIMAGVPDYSPLIQQTQQTFGDASNRLLAMYNALHNNFQNDAGTVGGVFDQAKTADQSAADNATGSINSAYDAARAAQTKQFNDLGIGDALAAIQANNAGSTTADQANALSRVASSNQANQNQLEANKSAALNYNTGIANSALQGGTDRAAQLQSQLAAAIAQIQQQQSNAYNSAYSQAIQAAQSGPSASDISSLANSLYNNDPNTQQYADKLYQSQQKQQGTDINSILRAMGALGNNNQKTPMTPQQILAIINQMRATG